MVRQEQDQEKSSKELILGILAAMTLVAGGILLVSAPAESLMGESVYSIRSAFHGLFAGLFMITVTMGLYQAFRLWLGTPMPVKEMEVGSLLNAALCFLTILFGNWIYIPYRTAGGTQSYFLEKVPEIHQIFFEFKEFTALFTLPFAVAAAYLICRYGERLNADKQVREMVALLLLLTFFYFAVAFGLGAAITKLKSV